VGGGRARPIAGGLAAAALVGILVIADGRLPAEDDAAPTSYTPAACGLVAIAALGAVACLYLPLPWGGFAAWGLIVAMLVTLRSVGG